MTNVNPSQAEELRNRLYDDLKSNEVESPQFAAAFKHLLTLEERQEIDPETAQLEKERLRLTVERERLELDPEISGLEKERLKISIDRERLELNNVVAEKTPWYKSEAVIGAVITAGAGLAGVVVIVVAEQFGTVILNTKAMNRLPKP